MSNHVIECLRAELAALREQLATMTQAVGLASTIKGEMPMRPDDPIGMMQEIVAAVAALRAQLAERDAEIAALKGYAEAMYESLELALPCGCTAVAADNYRAAYPKEADK